MNITPPVVAGHATWPPLDSDSSAASSPTGSPSSGQHGPQGASHAEVYIIPRLFIHPYASSAADLAARGPEYIIHEEYGRLERTVPIRGVTLSGGVVVDSDGYFVYNARPTLELYFGGTSSGWDRYYHFRVEVICDGTYSEHGAASVTLYHYTVLLAVVTDTDRLGAAVQRHDYLPCLHTIHVAMCAISRKEVLDRGDIVPSLDARSPSERSWQQGVREPVGTYLRRVVARRGVAVEIRRPDCVQIGNGLYMDMHTGDVSTERTVCVPMRGYVVVAPRRAGARHALLNVLVARGPRKRAADVLQIVDVDPARRAWATLGVGAATLLARVIRTRAVLHLVHDSCLVQEWGGCDRVRAAFPGAVVCVVGEESDWDRVRVRDILEADLVVVTYKAFCHQKGVCVTQPAYRPSEYLSCIARRLRILLRRPAHRILDETTPCLEFFEFADVVYGESAHIVAKSSLFKRCIGLHARTRWCVASALHVRAGRGRPAVTPRAVLWRWLVLTDNLDAMRNSVETAPRNGLLFLPTYLVLGTAALVELFVGQVLVQASLPSDVDSALPLVAARRLVPDASVTLLVNYLEKHEQWAESARAEEGVPVCAKLVAEILGDTCLDETAPYLTDTICTICADTIRGWHTRAPCAHLFHTACLREWCYQSPGGTPCPVCRTVFYVGEAYRVYACAEPPPPGAELDTRVGSAAEGEDAAGTAGASLAHASDATASAGELKYRSPSQGVTEFCMELAAESPKWCYIRAAIDNLRVQRRRVVIYLDTDSTHKYAFLSRAVGTDAVMVNLDAHPQFCRATQRRLSTCDVVVVSRTSIYTHYIVENVSAVYILARVMPDTVDRVAVHLHDMCYGCTPGAADVGRDTDKRTTPEPVACLRGGVSARSVPEYAVLTYANADDVVFE